MMNAAVRTEPMTLDEFVRLYNTEGPFEIINGEKIPKMPTVVEHGTLGKRLFRILSKYEDLGVGEVFFEMPFVLDDTPNWVKGSRVPDLMFYQAARLAEYRAQNPDYKSKPFVLIPDLAVEIISPTDKYSEVDAKAETYLQDGVQQVWVIDPRRQVVMVYHANSKQLTRLTSADHLEGGPLLPDLNVSIADLLG